MNFLRQLGYNLLFFVIFAVGWPYFLYRLRKRGHVLADCWERLGIYPSGLRTRLKNRADLWIHAVSVGEVMIAQAILRYLREANPALRVVISTTTATGRRLAKKLEDDQTTVVYNPVDFLWCVRQSLNWIRPKRLVLVESEIWPNLIWAAKRRSIPVYLVNARLSRRTERRYQRFAFFCQPVLQQIDLVFSQYESDIPRLANSGFSAHAIFNTGSIKYDVADTPSDSEKNIDSWWPRLGWPKNATVLLAASTHPGEEEIILRLFKDLRETHPDLRLVITPRHAERGPGILQLCDSFDIPAVLRSELENSGTFADKIPKNGSGTAQAVALVVNTTGELKALYQKATLVFVGKSLRGQGGQNFIEATRLGVPTLIGPNMQNFPEQTRDFLERNAVIQVHDEFELAQQIRVLLADPSARQALGNRGLETFRRNLGAAQKTARALADSLRS
jgi:3-deoxy-D-manno-octulosonic-acid transferase